MDPVSVFIIGLLLSIIGYLIIEGRMAQKEQNKRFQDLIEKNTEAFVGLNSTIITIKSDYNNLLKNYEEHKVVCGYPKANTNHKTSS